MSQSPSPTPAGTPVDQAKADLSRRLGTDPAEITVVSAEEVTWRDGSIGCPQPGMMYTQALTPGERIVLQVAGKRYEYHSGSGRAPFLCEKPQHPVKR